MTAWIDGVHTTAPVISARDLTLLRGDGCFEAIRSYGGRLFAADDHLRRLEASARALRLPLPPREAIEQWITDAAEVSGDAVLRVVVTRGDGSGHGSVIVLAEPLPAVPDAYRLHVVAAPWHPAGRPWELAGVKSVSYAPNMAASRVAREAGADDALLVSDQGEVLEGPTFSIAWLVDGVLETPSLELGILESVTRRHVLAIANTLSQPVSEGRFEIGRLASADEVMVWSTIKEVRPVVSIDGKDFNQGPATQRLAEEFRRRVSR